MRDRNWVANGPEYIVLIHLEAQTCEDCSRTKEKWRLTSSNAFEYIYATTFRIPNPTLRVQGPVHIGLPYSGSVADVWSCARHITGRARRTLRGLNGG